ncbi:ubiquitin system component Cue domain containing protein [Tieghemostelium lacteum]|uniref:Ubiquitin system component Cue domain containing protein n=1 Tax=Tieghemostelium lacteum TaxID=361077 RepID=A0A151ZK79_TIELA|nr:ubiquitin system component Cue domain containing protein [Tieghemostelium lacteum]|eukprot:KYQ94402.1 ubiquitin system component Cue domain containing protein [Tieghemostelium lacteum]
MSFFSRTISPHEKEKRIESVLAMFPLLSRDHFLYSTMDRYNWDLNQAVDSLRRRHEYLEQEQRNIERRFEENRLKREREQREIELIGKLRDIFGSKYTHDQYQRAIVNHRLNLEETVQYFMSEIDRQQRQDEISRRNRLEEEDRRRRQRERDEQLRQERNRDRINDLLLELKYQPEDTKREIYNSRIFKDVVKDFKNVMEPYSPPPQAIPQPVYVISPQPQPHQPNLYPTHLNNNNNPFLPLPHPTPNPLAFDPIPLQPKPMTTMIPTQPPKNPFENLVLPPPNNSQISSALFKELKSMFPCVTDNEINAILISSEGNITVAIQNLLDLSSKR